MAARRDQEKAMIESERSRWRSYQVSKGGHPPGRGEKMKYGKLTCALKSLSSSVDTKLHVKYATNAVDMNNTNMTNDRV